MPYVPRNVAQQLQGIISTITKIVPDNWLFINSTPVLCGAYNYGPKLKCQHEKGRGWFSNKIRTKNYKTPMVNLFQNFWPFQNCNFKIQSDIHFLTILNIGHPLNFFFLIEIWTFSFQICVWNQFWASGSGQMKICNYKYTLMPGQP